MSADERKTSIRVGIFLAVALVIGGMAIFAIGEKSGLFEGKTTLYVYFDNINGLVEGAPVRLAGLDVGTVSHIEFPDQLQRKEARVTISIKSRYMGRIRQDSVAFIDSKGLLGDKLINITLGSADAAPVEEGATLGTRQSPSMEHLANQVEDTLAAVKRVTDTAEATIAELATEDVRTDVGRIVKSVANILQEVEEGDGVAHRLVYDEKYADEIEGILVETRTAIVRMRMATERIDKTIAAIEHGDGMLHEMVYGDTGKATVAELRNAATELAAVVHEVREGDGLLHDLIFEEEEAKILDELHAAATRVNRIVEHVEKGRGTLGGLVVDPSVYEDLKTVLGNVERNVLLKALIRFTIKEGDIERPANVPVRQSGAEAQ
jgi:phospholipid/cholesterol/gamma-HCH transport system substrate-binding protein